MHYSHTFTHSFSPCQGLTLEPLRGSQDPSPRPPASFNTPSVRGMAYNFPKFIKTIPTFDFPQNPHCNCSFSGQNLNMQYISNSMFLYLRSKKSCLISHIMKTIQCIYL